MREIDATHFQSGKRISFARIAILSQARDVIDPWLPRIQGFAPSFQKLEWNWKGGPRDLWQTIIQFRASGKHLIAVSIAAVRARNGGA